MQGNLQENTNRKNVCDGKPRAAFWLRHHVAASNVRRQHEIDI